MRTYRLATLLLVTLLFAGATDLAAQYRTRDGGGSRRGGSTSGGRRSYGGARTSAARAYPRARIRTSRGVRIVSGYRVGACVNCNNWGYYRDYWGWYHGGWWYPAYYPRYHQPSYQDVPEAEEVEPTEPAPSEAEPSGPAPRRVHGVGALTAQYFEQDLSQSQTQAGRFALEYGYGLFHGEVGYSQYVEPVSGGFDRLHTWRAAAGVQPRLTPHSTLLAAIGVRGVILGNGEDAYGPEAELGLALRPLTPIGLNANGRAATVSFNGTDRVRFREANATGSLFLGPLELQGGWHWMELGTAPVIQGPVAGVRIWF